MLSDAAIATLTDYKQYLLSTPREIVWNVPHDDVEHVFEAQDSLDGRDHALWAGECLVKVLKRNDLDVRSHLVESKLWAIKVLRRRYLVRKEFIEIAYQRALEMAEKR